MLVNVDSVNIPIFPQSDITEVSSGMQELYFRTTDLTEKPLQWFVWVHRPDLDTLSGYDPCGPNMWTLGYSFIEKHWEQSHVCKLAVASYQASSLFSHMTWNGKVRNALCQVYIASMG